MRSGEWPTWRPRQQEGGTVRRDAGEREDQGRDLRRDTTASITDQQTILTQSVGPSSRRPPRTHAPPSTRTEAVNLAAVVGAMGLVLEEASEAVHLGAGAAVAAAVATAAPVDEATDVTGVGGEDEDIPPTTSTLRHVRRTPEH